MKESAPKRHGLKKDRYSKIRGGNSCFFDIFCSACGNHVILYQKDGTGRLLRAYLDRIFAPAIFVGLQGNGKDKKSLPILKCTTCQGNIGIPMVYGPEKRLAFRLIRGSFSKKNSDGTHPPI
jgi:hypothetical protein